MSRYDEICAVASDAREQWIAKKDRCYQAINSLLFGLRDYCTIPDEQILYLRWNGYKDGAFSLPGDGSKYTLLGAIEYSEDDDEWNIGVCIYLSKANVVSRLRITFGLFVTERDGKLMWRVGPDKWRSIDINVQNQRDEFFKIVVERMKASFHESRKESKTHGFEFEPDPR